MVSIKIPQPLRKCTGGKYEVAYNAKTVKDVLLQLENDYPEIRARLKDENGDLRRFINIFVNGQDIRLTEGENTKLKDGDEVSILPAIAGG